MSEEKISSPTYFTPPKIDPATPAKYDLVYSLQNKWFSFNGLTLPGVSLLQALPMQLCQWRVYKINILSIPTWEGNDNELEEPVT